jgi:hypothetical protein
MVVQSAQCLLALNFVKIHFAKSKCYPKSNVKVNVLNLSDRVKILDLLNCTMSLVEGEWRYGKNESSIHCTVQKSMKPEHSWLFFNGSLLGAIYLWTPRVYCIIIQEETTQQ